MKSLYKLGVVLGLAGLIMASLAQAQQTAGPAEAMPQPMDVDILQPMVFDAVDTEAGIITLEGVDYELNLIDDGFFSRQEKWKPLKRLRSGKKYIVHVYFDDEAAMKQRKGGSVVYIGELPPPY